MMDIANCPFCGAEAVLARANVNQPVQRYYVFCTRQGCANGPVCDSAEDAIFAWNRAAASSKKVRIEKQWLDDLRDYEKSIRDVAVKELCNSVAIAHMRYAIRTLLDYIERGSAEEGNREGAKGAKPGGE